MHKPISWWTLGFVCIALVVGVLSYRGWMQDQIAELNEKETALTVTLARLNADSNDLRVQISRVGTDADIEEKARNEYGYMKDGELRFEFTNPEMLDKDTAAERAIREMELGELEE